MPLSADPLNWMLAGLTAAAWGMMTFGTAWRHRAGSAMTGQGAGAGALLIGYASQSGTAEGFARAAGAASGARVLPLDRIGAADLAGAGRALFFISTTGDGDAPDNAIGFLRRVMAERPGLQGLGYALLALGDRHYPRFCGFAHRMDAWLRECGARPFLPLTELDRDQPETLAAWQARLAETGELAEAGKLAAAAAPAPLWQLHERRHLNKGSPGGPLWHLVFRPEGVLPDWQAGDIAVIEIPTASGVIRRDYSLASLPGAGQAELILREVIAENGAVGVGSHWLTRILAPGGTVSLRIRANPGFRPIDDAAPMLLIGNGSGLAGLLSHLRHRAVTPGAGPVWLIHGERSAEHDAIFETELQEFCRAGQLARLERSFSRSAQHARYVQDLVRRRADDVRQLVAAGGSIWLCGRREGMAGDVLAALADVLGPDVPEALIGEGRLRRDVY